jgi:antitoxin component YwqK of YwqJK toxin-antitoxin module
MLKRHKIRILLILLIVVATSAIVYYFVIDQPKEKISLYRGIPEDARFVVKISNIEALNNAFQDVEALNIWFNDEEIGNIFNSFIRLNSLAGESEKTSQILNEAELAVSFHPSGERNSFVFLIGLSDTYQMNNIIDAISTLAHEFGFERVNERKGEHRVDLIREQDTLYCGLSANVVTITSNLSLHLTSVQQMKSEKPVIWEQFKDQKREKGELFSVLTLESGLIQYVHSLLIENHMFPDFLLPDSGSIACIFNNGRLFFNTKGRFSETSIPITSETLIIRNTAFRLSDVCFGTGVELSLFGLPGEFVEMFHPVGNEIILSPQPGETLCQSVMLFQLKDGTFSTVDEEYFEKKTAFIGRKMPEEILKNYHFGNMYAGMLKSDSMFGHNHLLYSMLKPYRYFIMNETYMILAQTPDMLENVIVETELFVEGFYSDSYPYSAILDVPGFYPFLLASAKPETEFQLRRLYPVIAAFKTLNYTVRENTRLIEVTFRPDGSKYLLDEKAGILFDYVIFKNQEMNDSILSVPVNLFASQSDGSHTLFYPDSMVRAKGTYTNGKATGTWRFYYPDGSYRASVEYQNNKAEGKAVFYRNKPEGRMLISCSFIKNKLSGQYILFHKNGKPAFSVLYSNGTLQGKARFYYTTGTIMAEAEIKNDELVRPFSLYTVAGDFIDPADFNASRLVLLNYQAFINAQRMLLHKKGP